MEVIEHSNKYCFGMIENQFGTIENYQRQNYGT